MSSPEGSRTSAQHGVREVMRQNAASGATAAGIWHAISVRHGTRPAAILSALGLAMAVAMPLIGGVGFAQNPPPKAEPSVPNTAKPAEKPRLRPKSLRFTVVTHDDDKPVANARATVHMYGDKPSVERELTTDGAGVATFEYPDGDRPVNLWAKVQHPGLVPYHVGFGIDLAPGALPIQKAIRMDRGKKVGGKVVDPEGRPVAGVHLSIMIPATDTPREVYYSLLDDKSAPDGSWVLDGAPLDGTSLQITVDDPRFVPSAYSVQDRLDGRYVLNPGLTMTGRVTNSAGKPVPDAKITVARDRFGYLEASEKTQADGTYVVRALKPQTTWVTAEAAGLSPQIKQIEFDRNASPIDFTLQPGHTVRFKVIDPEGRPIPGSRIVADTWRGLRTLWWETSTDAAGLASWNGAPEEPILYDILHRNYAAVRNVRISPREEPHVVQLPRPLLVHGTVTDAKGIKVPEFRVYLGRKYSGRDEVRWLGHRGTIARNGDFDLQYDETCDAVYLRVEADGYHPWTSQPIPFGPTKQNLEIRLVAGAGPTGTVWHAYGWPVPGARLTLVTPSQGMQFLGGYSPSGGKQTVVSDANGRFEFLPWEGPGLITAVDNSGYAEKTLEEVRHAHGVRWQPWARLEVIVRRGKNPLVGAQVRVDPLETTDPRTGRRPSVSVSSYGIADITKPEGRVVFPRVVPRPVFVSLCLEQPLGRGVMVYAERGAKVNLAPRKTARLELGGSGCALVGRLSVPGKPPSPHQWALNEAVQIATKSEDAAARHYYRCLIDKDGAFRIDDIPPGQYELSVNLTAVPDANQSSPGPRIGRITRSIDVPADKSVLDLGLIQGEWIKRR